MGFKVFVDANIILDYALQRNSSIASGNILKKAFAGEIQAYITPAIVHIVGYWLTKSYGNAKAKELLLSLLTYVNVIDVTHEVTITALHSKMDDIEDALQYYAAIHHNLDFFISLDKKLNKASIPTLPVYSPEEWIKEFA